jgi:hypothetical protein
LLSTQAPPDPPPNSPAEQPASTPSDGSPDPPCPFCHRGRMCLIQTLLPTIRPP